MIILLIGKISGISQLVCSVIESHNSHCLPVIFSNLGIVSCLLICLSFANTVNNRRYYYLECI